ncbi:PGPGW domain-containing protein [Brevundimonas sp.]|uniref:PGPGW domain-containing protein n=1 Tax=Brevundimonas sp. TaxID=1871086 RepID=UPI0028A26CB2|nr:PGPGW domain-containing protein [Brevundimonas sp.]
MTLALIPFRADSQPRQKAGLLRRAKRWGMMALGFLIIGLGILIAPLPGPGGAPVIALGLILLLRNSWWAKRQFIRAQYARPKWVYPFRRLMRKNPEIAPVFWQQALRAEKVVLRKRPSRQLIRVRKRVRRAFRKLFR